MPRAKQKQARGTYKENCERFKGENKLEFGELVLESQENPGDGPIKIKCGDGVHDYEDLPYTAGSDEDQNEVMKRLTIETYELKKTLRSIVLFTCIVGCILLLGMGVLAFLSFDHFRDFEKRITAIESTDTTTEEDNTEEDVDDKSEDEEETTDEKESSDDKDSIDEETDEESEEDYEDEEDE